MSGFARRHPAITAIGAATVGLLGGAELALGVLVGAGVMAMTRGRQGRMLEGESIREEAHEAREKAHEMREKARQVLASDELKKRARAVMQAARGKLQPGT